MVLKKGLNSIKDIIEAQLDFKLIFLFIWNYKTVRYNWSFKADFWNYEYHHDLCYEVLYHLCICLWKTVFQNYVQCKGLYIVSKFHKSWCLLFLVLKMDLDSFKSLIEAKMDFKTPYKKSFYFLLSEMLKQWFLFDLWELILNMMNIIRI